MTEAPTVRMQTGLYWTTGGFAILHDDGEGGTGDWVVVRRESGGYDTDNPLAFCATLRKARAFIAETLTP